VSSGYTKLFSSIVTSTIWREPPIVCKVWITMLALSDRDGIVEGSIPGLAHLAGVSIEEVQNAIDRFMGPDQFSRTPEHEGRRIEAIPGGWRLLNYEKYRLKLSKEDIRERDRVRKQRQRELQKASCPTKSGTKRDSSEMSAKSNKSRKQKAKSKNECAAGYDEAFDGSEWALKTFKEYPKWGDPDATVVPASLGELYMATIEAEAPARCGLLKTAEWLLDVTREFAKQSADTEPKFIPGLEKFLRQGYAEVKLPTSRRLTGPYVPAESDEECEKRLREEARQRRAAQSEVAPL
jgi:hypothetical protein